MFSKMRSGVTSQLTEDLGVHTAAAKEMRLEYKKDLAAASDEHAVIVMDFSQNLALSSVTSTPSQWYFLSLVNVHMFGIYYANKEIQYNYVYDESTAGKGTDEVNSMLHHFTKKIVLPNGHRQLTIYADNCGGQNKNNYVLKMLLAVAQMGELERVELKVFVNGHTKNAVDRGFGHVRKKFAKEGVWTTAKLREVVNSASVSSALVHIPHDNGIM
ncbi:hypothetical protein PF002_g6108 [Phytophthora fragariae]|uniref:DUF7869 domain-containing protein n=2 Tax=Phytophthora fragariae TaxID=53985 RepID=A0A6A4A0K2_9STRA|nr:hypothetical protein PF002_g6108 [Phytophthora fragariae]